MNLQGNGHHFYGVSRAGAGAYRAMKEIQEQQREHDARKQAAAPVNPVDEARKLARALMNRVGMTDYGRFWDSVSDGTSAEQDLSYLQMMTRYIESEGDFDKALARLKDYVRTEGNNG